MIQAPDRYSDNLKLRLAPRLSMALKHIRHPTIPQLRKEILFENDTGIQIPRTVNQEKRSPLS